MKNEGLQKYLEKNDYLEQFYDEIEPLDFYRAIFGDGILEDKGCQDQNKPNGIIVAIDNDKPRRFFFHNDLEDIKTTQNIPFAITSPVSYHGLERTSKNAWYLHGITIDLDGVEMKNLRDLIHQVNNEILPKPTYIVNSGTGFHIYYIFEKPVPCYPHVKEKMKNLKFALTRRIWNRYTSSIENVQIQGLFQGFRVVGSLTKHGEGYPVRAFEFGPKVSIEYLNGFVPEEDRVDGIKYKSELTLDEAKSKYPEWYENRIVKGEPKKHWTNNRALYDWWYKRIFNEATFGHRYFCVMCLAIYASKCNISYEELEDDAFGLIDHLDRLSEVGNSFTKQDVLKALEAYNEDYITFPRDDISKITHIEIKPNKRNGRTQEKHLERARAVQKIDYPNDEWRNKDGRPSKKNQVELYQILNPEKRKIDCIKELGLSKSVVYKYWKKMV